MRAVPSGAAAICSVLCSWSTPFVAEGRPAVPAGGEVFYVATTGNDAWSGRLPAPNGRKTDGPFASLSRARDAIRKLRVE